MKTDSEYGEMECRWAWKTLLSLMEGYFFGMISGGVLVYLVCR